MNKISVNVPVRAYLAKYIAARLGTSTISATMRSELGAQIVSFFEGRQTRSSQSFDEDKLSQTAPISFITVELVAIPTQGLIFEPNTIRRFERHIEQAFRHDMMLFVVYRKSVHTGGYKLKEAIEAYLKLFKVEEDEFSLESAIKHYQRHVTEYSCYKLFNS